MRKSRFTEAQIVAILKEGDAGRPVAELLRKHEISSATYYAWKAKYGGTQRVGVEATERARCREHAAEAPVRGPGARKSGVEGSHRPKTLTPSAKRDADT